MLIARLQAKKSEGAMERKSIKKQISVNSLNLIAPDETLDWDEIGGDE